MVTMTSTDEHKPVRQFWLPGQRALERPAGEVRVDVRLTNAAELLIGQTVLDQLDLFVDWAGRRLATNPAHTNPAHTDKPVTKVT